MGDPMAATTLDDTAYLLIAASSEAMLSLAAPSVARHLNISEAQAKALAASPVPVIVAVSCNPNSFGRDAKILMEGGYRLTTLWPVAQFRWSSHVELVARFERQA